MGTTIAALVNRVVDGDTIDVDLDGRPTERLRILGLDTEEVFAGSSKPVTPLGHAASDAVKALLTVGTEVTLEFPGNEDPDVAFARYRDNFDRLLVHLHLGDLDLTEHLIAEGLSPYFSKYGNATVNHDRYVAAERRAQSAHLGVWDQATHNGSVRRDYAVLKTWWDLRAEVVDRYRREQATDSDLLDSRLDYHAIRRRASEHPGEVATIFTEIRSYQRVGAIHARALIGSVAQPFQLFIPRADEPPAQAVLWLLDSRYIGTEAAPRRGYLYVTGPLELYGDHPEIVVTDWRQLGDEPVLDLSAHDATSGAISPAG